MLFCEKCKVELPGSPIQCPLCQEDITGAPEPEENIFPVIKPKEKRFKKLIRWGAFISIVTCIISVAVNYVIPDGGWWSLFVIAGFASFWTSFKIAEVKRRSIPKTILWQVTVVSILAFLWDYFTGFNRWSLEYVIPVLYSAALIGMAIIAKVKHLRIEDFIFYFFVTGFLGMFLLLLIIFRAVHTIYPVLVCFLLSVISLFTLIFFYNKALKREFQRRMHI